MPDGALTGIVHERPLLVALQSGDVAEIFATVAVPPFTATPTDTAEAEMNCARRVFAVAAVAFGITSTAVPLVNAAGCDCVGSDPPP